MGYIGVQGLGFRAIKVYGFMGLGFRVWGLAILCLRLRGRGLGLTLKSKWVVVRIMVPFGVP